MQLLDLAYKFFNRSAEAANTKLGTWIDWMTQEGGASSNTQKTKNNFTIIQNEMGNKVDNNFANAVGNFVEGDTTFIAPIQAGDLAAIQTKKVDVTGQSDMRVYVDRVKSSNNTINLTVTPPNASGRLGDLDLTVDTSEIATNDYVDQKISAVQAGDVIGIFGYGKIESGKEFPTNDMATGTTAFDFELNTVYEYNGTEWIAGTVLSPQNNAEIVIDSMVDGIDIVGSDMSGAKATGYYRPDDGGWQFTVDKNTQTIFDNDTIHSRNSDGAVEVNSQTFTITENTDKFIGESPMSFKGFWGNVLNKINGLITAIGTKLTIPTGTSDQVLDGTGTPKDMPTGKKYATIVIGNAQSGHMVGEVDYLCDGTNDITQFNAAMTATPSTGGKIVILEGTYNLSAPWGVTKNNVVIEGMGASTVLNMTGRQDLGDVKSYTTNSVIYINPTNFDYYGNFVIRDLKIKAESLYPGDISGIHIYGRANGTVISNVTFSVDGISSFGVYNATGCERIHIIGNTFENNGTSDFDGGASILLSDCTNCIIEENTIYSSNGSKASTAVGYGIYLKSINITKNNIVRNNVIKNGNSFIMTSGRTYGIYIDDCISMTISGNQIKNDFNIGNSQSVGKCYGLYIYNSSFISINDNTFAVGPIMFRSSTNSFAFYSEGDNKYSNFSNNNLACTTRANSEPGVSNAAGSAFTTNGTTSTALPGSATTIAAATAIGTGSVSGFNMV